AEGSHSRHVVRWASDAPRTSHIDWPIEKDLAVRAHRLLEQHAGRPLPLQMTLDKRIPIGGGLGGGSSDAAAMLMAANELFSLGLSPHALASLSTSLGSDIAFFIDEETMHAKGGSPAGGAGAAAAGTGGAAPHAGVGVGAPRAAIVTGLGDHIERIHSPAR